MKKYRWALNMLAGLLFLSVVLFFTGAKDLGEVASRIGLYLAINKKPENIIFVVLFSLFVGAIFWMITLFSARKSESDAGWLSKSIAAFLTVCLAVYIVAVILESITTHQLRLWPF